jgi:TPR repeat protein
MPTEPLEPSAKRRRFSLVRNVALAGALVAGGWWAGGQSSAPAQLADSAATARQADIPAPPAVSDTNAEVAALRKKATAGDASSQMALGRYYQYGRGVPKDETEAVKWYRLAAPQLRKEATAGDAESQAELGAAYQEGHGVPKDETEAVKWYRLAAKQGNSDATCTLGQSYTGGRGGQDPIEAAKWLGLCSPSRIAKVRRLATAGDTGDVSTVEVSRSVQAQYTLAFLYLDGYHGGRYPDFEELTAPIDTIEALKWLRLAAANWPANWEGSKSGDEVSPQEILKRIAESPADSRRREYPYAVQPAPTTSGRGPVPIRIRAACALQADEEGANDIFLAYGPLDEENGARLVELWRNSTSDLRRMAYIRCLNVNWNSKQ